MYTNLERNNNGHLFTNYPTVEASESNKCTIWDYHSIGLIFKLANDRLEAFCQLFFIHIILHIHDKLGVKDRVSFTILVDTRLYIFIRKNTFCFVY